MRNELSQNTSAKILEEEWVAPTMSLLERIIMLLYTVILEIFAVVNNSRWKETAKIKHSDVQRMYSNS